jgi:drug/metabolite transporter (DMT)-like permease
MRSFSPLAFAWVRVLGATVVMTLVARGRGEPLDRADRIRVVWLALLGVVLNATLFLAGLALTTAHTAAILITAIPVFVLAIAILIRQESATAAKTGGIVLAAAGALLVVGGEGLAGASASALGALMIVLNCLSYAVYLVMSKPLFVRLSATRVTARLFAIGTLLMLPISAPSLARQNWSAIPGTTWATVVLVIIGPTAGAYLLNAWALRYADSSLVAAYTYVQPVLTTVLAAIWLGERLQPFAGVAAIMIFAGVWIAGQRTEARG